MTVGAWTRTMTHEDGRYRIVTTNPEGDTRKVQEYGDGLEKAVKFGVAPAFGLLGAASIITDGILGKGLLGGQLAGGAAGGRAARITGAAFGAIVLGAGITFGLLANREEGLGTRLGMLPGGLPLPDRGETWSEHRPEAVPQVDRLIADFDHDGDGQIALTPTALSTEDERVRFLGAQPGTASGEVETYLPLLERIGSVDAESVSRDDLVAWASGFDADGDGWIGASERATIDDELQQARRVGPYDQLVNDRSTGRGDTGSSSTTAERSGP